MAKVAVLGFGVVGSGTVELLHNNFESIQKKAGKPLEVKYILDLRDFPGNEFESKLTKNFEDIYNDSEIEIVAECMGGLHPAYEFTKRLLEKGVSVVTPNKELVANKGAELLKIAKENGCNYFFEAAVAGAIPIIRPLHRCLAGNKISAIAGILNGTTNFILTKMINEKMDFDTALTLAQELGYAEKDPTADVMGHDACRKVCILASLAFGKQVYPDSVYCEGITKITLEDAEYAENFGGAIKLIGSVKKMDDGKILPIVRPAFVCYGNLISRVSDVFNAVAVYGDAVGETLFYGKGAGKFPTASAIVGDIIDISLQNETSISCTWEDSENTDFIADYKDDTVSFYVRANGLSAEKIAEIFGEVQYISRENAGDDEKAFVTSPILEREFEKKVSAVKENILAVIRVFEM